MIVITTKLYFTRRLTHKEKDIIRYFNSTKYHIYDVARITKRDTSMKKLWVDTTIFKIDI